MILRYARASGPGTTAALGLWALLIALSWAWGTRLNSEGAGLLLHAPPFHARWDLRIEPGLLLAVLAAAGFVWGGPILARLLSWRRLLWTSFFALAIWTLALALATGADGVLEPLRSPNEYLTAVPLVGSPGDFLSHFTERIGGYATHLRGHPPGMALVLWGLAQIGLPGSLPAALLVVVVGASSAPAVLISLRTVGGEERARSAAPYLVLLPAAIWLGVSADAFFTGVVAWAICLVLCAFERRGPRSALLGLTGGILFGAAAFLSYGLVLLAVIPVVVAISRRRVGPLLWAVGGSATVLIAFLAAGFWLLDGFTATREQYLMGVAMKRPYGYFLFDNLAALALALGPAVAVALARLRDPRVWLIVGAACAAVLIADLSGMSKGEVERIWLPFMPWLAAATVSLPRRLGAVRGWLGAQAACAIAIQVAVRTPW